MTVYGGPQPSLPPKKPDPVLLGAAAFLVVALIVGTVFAVQAFVSDGPSRTSNAERPDQNSAPAAEPSSAAAPSSAAPPSPTRSPTPAAAQPLVAAKPSLLRASHSGLCLQANDGNGAGAVQQPCDGNNRTELWVPQVLGGGPDTFTFVNTQDNRCLDVNGGAKDNGAQIVQWDCHGGPNQQWRLQRDGDGYRLVSLNSGRCIGVDAGRTDPGAPARQWDCDGSPNQRWQFVN